MIQAHLQLALPSCLAMTIGMAQFMMDVYFVGLSNNADLVSGVGLGNMALNLLGI